MSDFAHPDKFGYRMFADFTGADPRRRYDEHRVYNATEMARLAAEREEEGAWEQPSFQDSVDIGSRYEELSPNAGAIVGFDVEEDAVYGVSVDGVRHHFDEIDLVDPDNDNTPMAIGLSGFAQTGKTTVANYIESRYGYRRQHIAEPLRAMLRTLLLRFGMEDYMIDAYLTGQLKEQVIPCLGITSRRAQITLGTEWGRNLVHPDLWANLWAVEAEAAAEKKRMNDSVRFRNEEQAIQQELGGFTIMVKRPGTEPVAFSGWKWLSKQLYRFGCYWGVHPSERVDLLNPDYVIVNDGTVEELYRKIDGIMDDRGVRASV